MKDILIIQGNLIHNGKTVPLDIPASSFEILGKKKDITAQEALAIGLDISHLVDAQSGEAIVSSAEIAAIRAMNAGADLTKPNVLVPTLASLRTKAVARALGLKPVFTELEEVQITSREEHPQDKALPLTLKKGENESHMPMPFKYLPEAKIYEPSPIDRGFFKAEKENDVEAKLAVSIEEQLCSRFLIRVFLIGENILSAMQTQE